MPQKRTWTMRELRTLWQARLDGATTAELAEEAGTTPGTLRTLWRRYGMSIRGAPTRRGGARPGRRRRYKVPTNVLRAAYHLHFREGIPWRAVADRVQHARPHALRLTVRCWARAEGLPLVRVPNNGPNGCVR